MAPCAVKIQILKHLAAPSDEYPDWQNANKNWQGANIGNVGQIWLQAPCNKKTNWQAANKDWHAANFGTFLDPDQYNIRYAFVESAQSE